MVKRQIPHNSRFDLNLHYIVLQHGFISGFKFPLIQNIIFNEKEFSYGAMNAIANSLANYLREKGIRQGDNIAVILPNCPEFAFIYFAVAKLGAVFSPVDTRLGEAEINSILQDTKAKACFVYPGFALKDKLTKIPRHSGHCCRCRPGRSGFVFAYFRNHGKTKNCGVDQCKPG